jgi:hypothetical protein
MQNPRNITRKMEGGRETYRELQNALFPFSVICFDTDAF